MCFLLGCIGGVFLYPAKEFGHPGVGSGFTFLGASTEAEGGHTDLNELGAFLYIERSARVPLAGILFALLICSTQHPFTDLEVPTICVQNWQHHLLQLVWLFPACHQSSPTTSNALHPCIILGVILGQTYGA
ncbi:hypothetical protein E2C01_033754 [Portunus trituberculatus]|uniref:Uncharacterized protein n=1 Tax=Portunus trituberculatus TaxID=210409 RepID=A0A5B7F4W2_PORTR|nr:hypothetical protein [Portunus trituberculatus]